MTTTMTGPNGRVRKSLAEQIDRLDNILDGLADGLNEAVATSVKEAVCIAVREAVQGVFNNPGIQAKLKQQPTPKITWRQRFALLAKGIANRGQAICQGIKKGCCGVCRWFGKLWTKSIQGLGSLLKQVSVLGLFKWQLLIALGAATAAGAVAYFAGPWFAVAFSSVGGFCTTLAVQAVLWLRRMFDGFLMTGD